MAGVVFGPGGGIPPRRCDTAGATMMGDGGRHRHGRTKSTTTVGLSAGGAAAAAEKSRIERRLKELQRERARLLLEKKGIECCSNNSKGGLTHDSVIVSQQ